MAKNEEIGYNGVQVKRARVGVYRACLAAGEMEVEGSEALSIRAHL